MLVEGGTSRTVPTSAARAPMSSVAEEDAAIGLAVAESVPAAVAENTTRPAPEALNVQVKAVTAPAASVTGPGGTGAGPPICEVRPKPATSWSAGLSPVTVALPPLVTVSTTCTHWFGEVASGVTDSQAASAACGGSVYLMSRMSLEVSPAMNTSLGE